MTKLEEIISIVLRQRKSQLSASSFESLQRYCKQLSQMASKMDITTPCQELYDTFIDDDRGSKERSSRHRQCVKLVDYYADGETIKKALESVQDSPTLKKQKKWKDKEKYLLEFCGLN